MIENRLFDRIITTLESKSYVRNEETFGSVELIVYGLNTHLNKKREDNCILIACGSDQLKKKQKTSGLTRSK